MKHNEKEKWEGNEVAGLTDEEKIDLAAARILQHYRPAFEELAK